MFNTHSHKKEYAIGAIFGAVGGWVALALVKKAAPKLKAGIMQRMMEGMHKKGFSPAEM